MSALEKMREVFETCTVMAGVEPDFECVYITKDAADALIDEAEAENAKLLELASDMWRFMGTACRKYPRLFDQSAQGGQMVQPNALDAFEQRMNELGV